MSRWRPGDVVAFDLDDTLYDEADFVRSGIGAMRALLRGHGIACPPALAWAQFVARRPLIDGLCAALPAAAPHRAALLAAYRAHAPRLRPRPGARALLARLRTTGVRLALITDGRAACQRHKLGALGFADAFDHVAISAEVGHDKHHPAAFLQVMRALPAAAYTYIGDNPCKDVGWPLRLGWHAILVADPGRNVHRGGSLDAAAAASVGRADTLHSLLALAPLRAAGRPC